MWHKYDLQIKKIRFLALDVIGHFKMTGHSRIGQFNVVSDFKFHARFRKTDILIHERTKVDDARLKKA